MILVGYEGDSTNYRVDPETKRISVTRDATFHEQVGKVKEEEEVLLDEATVFRKTKGKVGEEDVAKEAVKEVEVEENFFQDQQEDRQRENENEAEEDRREQAVVPEPVRGLRDRALINRPARYVIDVAEYITPSSYEKATRGSDAAQWVRAIEEELRAHETNNTWSIVRKEPNMKTIDLKWVFRVKMDPNKKTQRFKARLCARGFMQKRGIDYTETFAPVVQYDSLRVLLAMVTEKDLELLQFDVQTVFLYGELKEDIFMEVPEGLNIETAIEEISVCKLNKSIYGLKQVLEPKVHKFSESILV